MKQPDPNPISRAAEILSKLAQIARIKMPSPDQAAKLLKTDEEKTQQLSGHFETKRLAVLKMLASKKK
jgi:hypothetical protein